ncbi:MAG: hypothetical protein GY819_07925 [Planctomycetaceae bacterium]|nr:hypothetical protein [Planctomycetaceae bacterium]
MRPFLACMDAATGLTTLVSTYTTVATRITTQQISLPASLTRPLARKTRPALFVISLRRSMPPSMMQTLKFLKVSPC